MIIAKNDMEKDFEGQACISFVIVTGGCVMYALLGSADIGVCGAIFFNVLVLRQ